MHPSPSRRRVSPALLALAVAAVAVFGVATPAWAHDALTGSDPAADATVDAVPAQLTLSFNAELLAAGGTEVQVTDAAGTAIADGAAVVSGTTVTQPLLPGATGTIAVLWRVVSSDGHPISGEFSFTVAAPAASAPAATSSDPTPTATSLVQVAPSPTATAPGTGAGTGTPLVAIVLGGVTVLAIGAVAALLLTRSRRGGTGGDREDSGGPAGR